MIVAGSTLTGPLQLKAQVVIVGTGAGGSIVAQRAAEAGLDVLILETGAYYRASDFTQREGEMMRKLYWEAGLRATENGAMAVMHGRAVGGSTVVNYLDCFRTPDRLLNLWKDSHNLPELAPERMRPRFERIEQILHVAKLDPAQLNPNNLKLKLGAEAMGWKGDTFHRNAYQCYGSGFCDLGCSYNAKQSAALTFIPLATAKGARLYSECRVDRVRFANGRAIGVEGHLLGEDRQSRGTFTVDADCVVVSGGSIQTPHLLLSSETDDASGQIGQNLWVHPATPVVGHFPGERIANYEGIKQGYYIGEFSWVLNEHPTDALIEGIGAPPGITSTILPGFGVERQKDFARYNEFAATGVLLRDHDAGEVRAGASRPEVHWTLSDGDAARLKDAIARTAEAYLAAGAAAVFTGHTRRLILRKPSDFAKLAEAGHAPGQLGMFCFHQMGTCRMGSSPDRDAVDPTGRVWAYPNLFVADASIFPSASGVNPQLTVYGLSDVVSDAIAGRAWAGGA